MARRIHKSTDRLPPEALRLLTAGFRAGKKYRAITQDLAQIGVAIPERTVARRGHEFYAAENRRQAAYDQARALVAAMRDEHLDAPEILVALATDALITDPDRFTGADPAKVQRLNLRAEELRLRRLDTDIKARQVAVDEKRLALLEAREHRARAAIEDLAKKDLRGEQLTTYDLQRIREIYGLN